MDGLALYEVLEKKIEELLGQTRRFQEDYRRLENQLQEKEKLLERQATALEQLRAERDEIKKHIENLIVRIEQKVENSRKATH